MTAKTNIYHGACLSCSCIDKETKCENCLFKTRKITDKSLDPDHLNKIICIFGNFNVTIKTREELSRISNIGEYKVEAIIFN